MSELVLPKKGTVSEKMFRACCRAGVLETARAIEFLQQSKDQNRYWINDGLSYLARGFGGYRVVPAVTRGAARNAPEKPYRSQFCVEVRPASSGRWGKSRRVRFVPIGEEQ